MNNPKDSEYDEFYSNDYIIFIAQSVLRQENYPRGPGLIILDLSLETSSRGSKSFRSARGICWEKFSVAG